MLFRGVIVRAGAYITIAALLLGCRSSRPEPRFQSAINSPPPGSGVTVEHSAHVRQVSHSDELQFVAAQDRALDPFADGSELDMSRLVDEVLSRNPSLQAMVWAWRAAAARYPQAVSLDDPMFGFMVGPSAINHPSGSDGFMLDASQKIPWHGKRYWRGQNALAGATAARADLDEARLRIIATTKAAWADYYVVERLQELNRENAKIMQAFRAAARVKYETNLVTQEDVLQAELEIAEVQRRSLELQRMERVAVARINTLLHRSPEYPLPPPPATSVAHGEAAPSVADLRQIAVQRRPELAAQAARIRAERAKLVLAQREYYPDLSVIARYDGFWEEPDLRPQVGMNVNVPLYQGKRDAAVCEALHRLNQERAELEQQIDNVQNEVQSAYEQFAESRRTLELYQSKILPAARQNVETARTTYTTATFDFLRLVESQRRYLMLQEKQREAEAELVRRAAELERSVGGPIELAIPTEEIPPAQP